MKQTEKFAPIVKRIEYLRTQLRMNKSKFSAEIGMKPQTYNNFIGSQGSKPNLELIHGIINIYGVNPLWLLNGDGAIFMEDSPSPYAKAGLADTIFQDSVVMEGGERMSHIALESLKKELRELEPIVYKFENTIRQLEMDKSPLVDRVLNLLKRYYEINPIDGAKFLKSIIEEIQNRSALV